jgi:PTS system fructose-specific IIC component
MLIQRLRVSGLLSFGPGGIDLPLEPLNVLIGPNGSALGLASTLFKNRFNQEERDAGKAAIVLGISFVTEGAIPFAAKDPLRVIPCLVAGSAVTGAISLASGVQLMVPHGGVFVLLIPHAVQHLGMYLVAIAAGTLVTTAAVKRPVIE